MSEDSSLYVFAQALWQCAQALPMTLLLTGLSVAAGFCMAVPLGIAHHRRHTLSARLVRAYVYFFTGTPLLVQIYLIYYGLPGFAFVNDLMQINALAFLKDGFAWVLLALLLNTAAYSTEIFSGAIRNTDAGEVEAARAYGMGTRMAMRRIILPSALRRALPAYSNEVILTMHATALASTVAVMEVTNAANLFVTETYQPFAAYAAAAVVYFTLTSTLVGGFKWLEGRYLRHVRHRG